MSAAQGGALLARAGGTTSPRRRIGTPLSPHEPVDSCCRLSIAQFCRQTRFEGLRIVEHVDGEQEAFVTFEATLTQAGRDASFSERSRFVRVEGRWAYHSGVGRQ